MIEIVPNYVDVKAAEEKKKAGGAKVERNANVNVNGEAQPYRHPAPSRHLIYQRREGRSAGDDAEAEITDVRMMVHRHRPEWLRCTSPDSLQVTVDAPPPC